MNERTNESTNKRTSERASERTAADAAAAAAAAATTSKSHNSQKQLHYTLAATSSDTDHGLIQSEKKTGTEDDPLQTTPATSRMGLSIFLAEATYDYVSCGRVVALSNRSTLISLSSARSGAVLLAACNSRQSIMQRRVPSLYTAP